MTETEFWQQVDKSGDCWIWLGGHCGRGYGRLYWNGRRVKAHRIAYELSLGPIPKGLLACHHCDNKRCVNPKHLFLGTQRDNMQDWTRKGKNRLVNESLGSKGDKHWSKTPEGRIQCSVQSKSALRGGRMVPIRGPKGRIMGMRRA